HARLRLGLAPRPSRAARQGAGEERPLRPRRRGAEHRHVRARQPAGDGRGRVVAGDVDRAGRADLRRDLHAGARRTGPPALFPPGAQARLCPAAGPGPQAPPRDRGQGGRGELRLRLRPRSGEAEGRTETPARGGAGDAARERQSSRTPRLMPAPMSAGPFTPAEPYTPSDSPLPSAVLTPPKTRC